MFLEKITSALEGFSKVLGLFAGGGIGGKRMVILDSEGERLTLPVTPAGYSMNTGQNNKVLNVVEYGEVIVFGNRKLKNLHLECFFPSLKHDYPFIVGDNINPTEVIELLEKWKEQKSPIRVIITDSSINLMMALNSFDYEEKDGSRDVYYALELAEYVDLNTPMANNDKKVNQTTGLKERAVSDKARIAHLKSNLDDNLDKVKRATGSYNNWQRVIKSKSLGELNANLRLATKKRGTRL